MCRWLAYSGSPIKLAELISKRKRSLIDQSLHSRLGAETTNGDGFGVGWYHEDEIPGIYHSVAPAWNDRNLHNLVEHIKSPLFFSHIRAATATAVQETNCHPFRHGKWLWMHNGVIRDWHVVKRDLQIAVDPDLFPYIEGSTDSETMFYLAKTFGLEDDPVTAVEKMVGFVEATGKEHGVEFPIQGTMATTDGECIWAFRYSSEGNSRTLFFSTAVDQLRKLHPEVEELWAVDSESRIVVSEPLGDLEGAWQEVPESSWGIIKPGPDELGSFQPRLP